MLGSPVDGRVDERRESFTVSIAMCSPLLRTEPGAPMTWGMVAVMVVIVVQVGPRAPGK